MKIAIIQFPGSNCETESLRAVRMAGMEAEEFLWKRNYNDLSKFDGYFIVGGFSYEDRSRSGIIASLDPLMPYIKNEAKKGKPVLGVCNGAQILVETGLVPGLQDDTVGMALAVNKRVRDNTVIGTGFYNTWVNIKLSVPSDTSAFTRNLQPNEFIRVPIAHGEGRFIMPSELLEEMIKNNQTILRYCDNAGAVIDEFPVNPNGAAYNLAAVTNPSGTIMAIMPHPERTPNGQPIFTSMRDYINEQKTTKISSGKIGGTLRFTPEPKQITHYTTPKNSFELPIELIISDNEAVTVENTLQNLGFPVQITRAIHWEIGTTLNTEHENAKKAIIASGELFNPSKERPYHSNRTDESEQSSLTVLIRYHDDFVGQHKKEALQARFGLKNITDIKQGILWRISTNRDTMEQLCYQILHTHILHNPYSQKCFIYSMTYENTIQKQLKNCLTQTNIAIGQKKIGKVRDTYDLPDKMVLITTDRQSAFDRVLAAIPFKGQVLNQTSAWWFEKTKHIVPNHVLSIPDPNVTVGKKCTVFGVEFVVRGYITGTTSTSAWVNYQNGIREYCGNTLPEGLKKNQKLEKPICTPTTKSDEHDRLINPQEIVSEGLMTQADWDYVSGKALELFAFGQKTAAQNGLILVDTKYEFGKDASGQITLIDEIHTPDSSRYWIANSYAERFAASQEPENIDKEFLRLWFTKNCDPYNDKELPPAPDDLVVELSRRYIQLYEMITGEKFVFPEENQKIEERIQKNLNTYL